MALFLPTLATELYLLPPAPSAVPVYKSQQTTTTDEDTSTFSAVDIHTPHPNRVIVLACYHGVAAACTGLVNGIAPYHISQDTSHEFAQLCFHVPKGTVAEIEVTAAGSARKAVGVFVLYPEDKIPKDWRTASAAGTTNANANNLTAISGGCLIYNGGQHSTLGTFTSSWSGDGTRVEDYDAQIESTASYTGGRVHTIGRSTNGVDDLVLNENTSGTKRLVVTSFGPPVGYPGLNQ